MAHQHHTPRAELLEEALSVLFCLVDDTYRHLNPEGTATSLSRSFRTRRSSPSRSSSSFVA